MLHYHDFRGFNTWHQDINSYLKARFHFISMIMYHKCMLVWVFQVAKEALVYPKGLRLECCWNNLNWVRTRSRSFWLQCLITESKKSRIQPDGCDCDHVYHWLYRVCCRVCLYVRFGCMRGFNPCYVWPFLCVLLFHWTCNVWTQFTLLHFLLY